MRTPTPRCLAIAFAVLCFALGSTGADAAGVVNISTCQTLSTPDTVYRLTEDLTACDECLIVTADRITIDLQGHSIIGTCDGSGVGIAGQDVDLTTVRNGSISGFGGGIDLLFSHRSQVLNVHAVDNLFAGIFVGTQSLVKSSSASGSLFGILADERSQIQDPMRASTFWSGLPRATAVSSPATRRTATRAAASRRASLARCPSTSPAERRHRDRRGRHSLSTQQQPRDAQHRQRQRRRRHRRPVPQHRDVQSSVGERSRL